MSAWRRCSAVTDAESVQQVAVGQAGARFAI